MASKWLFLVAVCALSSAGCSSGDEEETDKSGEDESGELALSVMIKSPLASTPGAAGLSCPTQTGVQWDIGVSSAKCFVQKSGSFHASAEGIDEQITPPDEHITLDVEGQASVGGTFTGSFYTPRTQTIQTGSSACNVTSITQVGEGELYLEFDCPLLTATDNPTLGCAASGELGLAGCGD